MAAAGGGPPGGGKGQGMAVAGCNYVGQDQIWKDHVKQEVSAAKIWPQNWDFMTMKYEDLKEMVKDDFPKKEREPIEVPTPLRTPDVARIEDHVKIEPSSQPVPRTSNSMIGWRSGDKNCRLDKYGGYARPRGGLIKQLNWPPEGID